ncbi:MAG: queuosine precursor transporter [Rectinemataceae bacterium]
MAKDDTSFSRLFLILFGTFLACLLLSNIIAGKLIQVFGVVLPAAVILFPVTYILGDIFTEVYGYARTRYIIWIGFAANLFMSLLFLIVVALPHPDFFVDQAAYARVLGSTPRVVAASLLAYWCGEFANSAALSVLKKATGGRQLWLRTIGSTVIGQIFDTALFIALAFAGTMPAKALLGMMLAQYLFKVLYEIVLTPVTYKVVAAVKRAEGIDAYDEGVTYNPFRLGGK